MALSMVSVNVNRLRDADKRLSFLQWLWHLSPSVVCLQKTHALSSDELSVWFSRFGYPCLGSFGSSHSCGVAILYRPMLSCSAMCDFGGRFVLAEFTFRDSVFRVACCYAPNRNPDRDAFLHRCTDSIDPSVPTLLCCDFNTVLDRVVDRRGSCPFDTPRESSILLSTPFRDCCVVDIWRLKHPDAPGFTWSRRDGSLASRIDLVGCPYSWISFVSSADVLSCPYSDHSALYLSWYLAPASPPGPGFWKLNTPILQEEDYFKLISDFGFPGGNVKVLVLNSAFTSGLMSRSQRRVVITLSFKKGDRLDPRNWHPITLLNVDYKIGSRSVSARLLKVLHLFVDKDQSCGVPGRFIGENVAFLRDVVDYRFLSGVPAALISLDQEKAFDRVDWSFLRSVFFPWALASFLLNGWICFIFALVLQLTSMDMLLNLFLCLVASVRAVRCLHFCIFWLLKFWLAIFGLIPLFVAVVFLALLLPFLVFRYTLMIPLSWFVRILRSVLFFLFFHITSVARGPNLTVLNATGLCLGSWSGCTDSPVDIEWTSESVKVLGVFVGSGNVEEANWTPRITAVEHVLNSWRQRSLSYGGRALVINAPVLHCVWYVASLIHVPRWVGVELNSLILKFFWGW